MSEPKPTGETVEPIECEPIADALARGLKFSRENRIQDGPSPEEAWAARPDGIDPDEG